MRIAVIDIETPLIPFHFTEVFVIVTKELGEEAKVWLEEDFPAFLEYAATVDRWIAHNGVSFDMPVLNKVLGAGLPTTWPGVIDTFVVSRLVNYKKFVTHSLKEVGLYFKYPKDNFKDFSGVSEEMIKYCIRDVKITERLYLMYRKHIHSSSWGEAMSLEHDTVIGCGIISDNGFQFDAAKAIDLLVNVRERMGEIEPVFQDLWPAQRVEEKRLKYRTNADGSLNGTLKKAMEVGEWELDGNEVVFYTYRKFNPGSTKDRVDKLWECGWKPFDKSKTHQQFTRAKVGEKWGKKVLTPALFKEKKEYFNHYGWKVSEENLATLPEDAPEAARLLAEWLTLEGRRSALETWLQCVSDDGRIHGKFWFIGAWTHRMAHSDPNSANIASPFHGTPKNGVEEVKAAYDHLLRSCWTVREGATLVGTDADGIQLRILAHFLRNDDYVEAIVNGKKEDETDIHNLNRKALLLNHLTRDHAKTFIYAWLLGAGTGRVASILQCSTALAGQAANSFVENTVGLSDLRNGQIRKDVRRGFFEGLDGRRVVCNSDHLMLAGYLQNGESVIMKRAFRLWREWADKEKILYYPVNFVHDEWQTECMGSRDMCENLGYLQRKAIERTGEELGLYCPLAGSTDYGTNWYETH